MDKPLLLAALKALGYEVTEQGNAILFSASGSYRVHRYENGKLVLQNVNDSTAFANEIKQAYSREVVKSTAARFGWNVKQNPLNKNSFVVQRRG